MSITVKLSFVIKTVCILLPEVLCMICLVQKTTPKTFVLKRGKSPWMNKFNGSDAAMLLLDQVSNSWILSVTMAFSQIGRWIYSCKIIELMMNLTKCTYYKILVNQAETVITNCMKLDTWHLILTVSIRIYGIITHLMCRLLNFKFMCKVWQRLLSVPFTQCIQQ